MNEIQIKTRLLSYLLHKDEEVIVGSEVPYSYGTRRADMMSLLCGRATAFEIKSEGDKISRLEHQLESYRAFFDYCYVVCERSNLSAVRRNISSSFGIILVTDEAVKVSRKSKRFKRHNKEALASILTTSELKKLTRQYNLRSKHELCRFASIKFTLSLICKLSRDKLAARYSPSTRLLKADVISKINPDDIQTITKHYPTDLSL